MCPDAGETPPDAVAVAVERESTFDRAKPLAMALLLLLGAVVLLQLLEELRHVLLLLFVAVVFAATLARPVAVLERRGVRRGFAVAIVHVVVLAVLVGIVVLVVPPLAGQLASFADRLPDYVSRVHELRARYDVVRRHYPELRSFDSQIDSMAGRVASSVGTRLVDLPTTSASLLYDVVTIVVLASLIVMRRERMLGGVLRLVHPRRRAATKAVLEKIWWRLGAYLRAKLIVMLVVGVLMYVTLRVLGVPFPLPLAILVALGELIPVVGVWIARIPLLAIAAFQGWLILVLTFVASVVIEDLKAYVISPRVQGQELNIDPLLVLIAVLIGGRLLGAVGAFIAVPFAAMLQVVFDEVILPWRLGQLGEGEGTHDPGGVPAS